MELYKVKIENDRAMSACACVWDEEYMDPLTPENEVCFVSIYAHDEEESLDIANRVVKGYLKYLE